MTGTGYGGPNDGDPRPEDAFLREDDEFNPYANLADDPAPAEDYGPIVETTGDGTADPLLNPDDALAAALEAEDENADLAGMYAKGKAMKDRPRLTINEGAPPPEVGSLKWLWVTLVLLGLVGGIAFVLFGIKKPWITLEGEQQNLSLVAYLKAKSGATDLEAALQTMGEEERGNLVTSMKIELAHAGAMEAVTSGAALPATTAGLVASGALSEAEATDGFGEPFMIIRSGSSLLVRSKGLDGVPATSDDWTYDGTRVTEPPAFEEFRINNERLFAE
jgi:hypothetical protein